MVCQIFLKKTVIEKSIEKNISKGGTVLFVYYVEYKEIEVKTESFAEFRRNRRIKVADKFKRDCLPR